MAGLAGLAGWLGDCDGQSASASAPFTHSEGEQLTVMGGRAGAAGSVLM